MVFLLATNNLVWTSRRPGQLEGDGNLFLMANSDNLTVINGCLNLGVVSTVLTKESCTTDDSTLMRIKGEIIDFTLNLPGVS